MSTNTPVFAECTDIEDARVAIVTAKWNSQFTFPLRDVAVKTLIEAGLEPADISCFEVPGAIELTFAASQLIEQSLFDAVIVFGCVVRGDTPHFDYVCQSVTQGVTALNADCDTPVIFGLLTVNNEEQARERIGGTHGHKGIEAARTALEMIEFKRQASRL